MLHREKGRTLGRWLLVTLMVLAAACIPAAPVRAAELSKQENSVSMVPADAAFYGAMLRNREQIEIIGKSRAWAKITALPGYQMALQMMQAQMKKPGSPMAQAMQAMETPENQQLIEMVGDMFSDEVFYYGDKSWVDFSDLTMQVLSAMRFGPAMSQFSNPGGDANKSLATAILKVLAKNQDRLKVPNLVFGFKLKDTERAEAQLKRLEDLVETQVMPQAPPQFKGRFKRTKTAGGSFLTLSLDGSLIPWDQVSFEQYEEKPGQFDDLKKALTEMKFTVSLGVRGKYLLLSTGETTKHLDQLGKGKALASIPEFAPYSKFADQKITSIGYVSKALMEAVGTKKKDIDDMFALGRQYLKKSGLPDESQDKIGKDMDELGDDIKAYMPEPGAILLFSMMTNRGFEGYFYNWGEHRTVDGSKPLTLLDHVGGSPLLAVVGRAKVSGNGYQLLVKWIKKGQGYVEEFVIPNFHGPQKEKYDEVAKWVYPLLNRLDEATGKELLPALADGQAGLVLDAKLTSKQWSKKMPPSDKPLPMLEPALIVGVSDAAKLRKAFEEYRAIFNETMTHLHEMQASIPELQIPEPQTKEVKEGIIYYYPLPEGLGIDPKISPNAALSEKIGILALSQEHSGRLLESNPLKVSGGPLEDRERPLAGATFFNWAGLVDAATPWLDYGFRLSQAQRLPEGGGEGAAAEGGKPSPMSPEGIYQQVKTVLEVLKVLHTYSSATYIEDKALVTHSETVIEDLPGGSD